MVNETEQIRKAHDKAIDDAIEIATKLAKVSNELENTKTALDIVTEESLQAKEELEEVELRELQLKEELKTKESALTEAYKIIQTLNEKDEANKETIKALITNQVTLKNSLMTLSFFDRVFNFQNFINKNVL